MFVAQLGAYKPMRPFSRQYLALGRAVIAVKQQMNVRVAILMCLRNYEEPKGAREVANPFQVFSYALQGDSRALR